MYIHIHRRHAVVALLGLALALSGIMAVHSASARSLHGATREGRMGAMRMGTVREWTGFYDGHNVIYLNTDVSTRQQASMMGINFAPGLQHANKGSMPEIYLVQGRAAVNQLAVFGSEPGEKDYSPLWQETILTWKAGAKPVLVTSDTQINAIEKKGQMTERSAGVLLNCPIIRVMK
jgi:hypothetical protein